jgi:hypothetical protein
MVQVQDLGHNRFKKRLLVGEVQWRIGCRGDFPSSSWGYHNRIDVVGAVGKVVVEASKKNAATFCPRFRVQF